MGPPSLDKNQDLGPPPGSKIPAKAPAPAYDANGRGEPQETSVPLTPLTEPGLPAARSSFSAPPTPPGTSPGPLRVTVVQ